jgi:hypothetical protein
MRHISSRRRAENEPFAPDSRPDAANFVYCVGCGKKLTQRSGLLRVRGAAINIYCEKCQGRDVNAWGEEAPITYCFRCGTQHVRYIETEPYRTIHAICPRCRPERANRYAAGDFAPLPPPPEEPAEGEQAAPAAGATPGTVAAPAAVVAPVEVLPEPEKKGRKQAS